MRVFIVKVLAVESDEDQGLFLGETVISADNIQQATDKAYDKFWDERLSITCSPRIEIKDVELSEFAEQFIDASPEDTMSVDEYDWSFEMLSQKDLEDTGLLKGLAEHAKNLNLNPMLSDLSRPVVVSLGDKTPHRVEIWDGVHRILSALKLGSYPLPAIVGTRKTDGLN